MAGEAELSYRKRINQSESTVNDRRKLILTDLNDDCLVAIFNHLDMDDLMNITEASARFSLAAGLAVRRKEVLVTNNYHQNPAKVPPSVKMLKKFGRFVSKMIIEYELEFRHFDKLIEDIITEHCRNSLLEIAFVNADRFTLHENIDCFPNVLKVKFMEGQWSNVIAEFNEWFPNAQSLDLEFEDLQFEDLECPSLHNLRQNFPSLTHLGLIAHFGEDGDGIHFSIEDVLEIFKQNPQLKSIKIQDMRGDVLSYINKLLPELKSLELHMGYEGENCEIDDERANALLFENLKYLKVKMEYSSRSELADISISTTQLEKLELEHCFEMKGEVIKFLYDNRNMHTLRLNFQCDGNETANNLMELFPKLPNLRELEMDYQHVSLMIIQLIKMLNSCKSLVKMIINRCDVNEREGFEQLTLSTGELMGTAFKTDIRHQSRMVVLNKSSIKYINE